MSKKNNPPFFWVENHEFSWFFFDFDSKKCFRVRLHGVCMGRSGTGASAVFSGFPDVGVFDDLVTSWYPLRGASDDVVTAYAY